MKIEFELKQSQIEGRMYESAWNGQKLGQSVGDPRQCHFTFVNPIQACSMELGHENLRFCRLDDGHSSGMVRVQLFGWIRLKMLSRLAVEMGCGSNWVSQVWVCVHAAFQMFWRQNVYFFNYLMMIHIPMNIYRPKIN